MKNFTVSLVSGVICAGITVKVEHLGLVFRKMHSQSYDGAFNIAGMTTGMVALMLTNNQKSNANSPVQECVCVTNASVVMELP